jgi:hypothetical protein
MATACQRNTLMLLVTHRTRRSVQIIHPLKNGIKTEGGAQVGSRISETARRKGERRRKRDASSTVTAQSVTKDRITTGTVRM